MIEPKDLEKIKITCQDASGGYATVSNQIYYRDVSALLADRKELLAEIAKLKDEIDQLVREDTKQDTGGEREEESEGVP